MGCCVSIPYPTNQQVTSGHKYPLHPLSKSPPRSDEESVKEVLLSETSTAAHDKTNGAENMPNFNPTRKILEKPRSEFKSPGTAAADATSSEEISDLSQIHGNLGDSFEKREYAIAAAAQRVNRSPARRSRKGSFSGDLGRLRNEDSGSHAARRSPARRSANPSPRRRNEDCGLLGRERPGHVRRGLGLVDGQMICADSSRRSRSPGTRVEVSVGRRGNMGRSHSGKRNGPSPGRMRMVQLQADDNNNDGHDDDDGNRRSEEENGSVGRWATHPNDSLDNPLVSLECFIFL